MYKTISLLCLAVLPYIFSLHGDFVFDDSEAIVKNKNVYSGSWSDSFSKDFWGTNIRSNLSHKSYRPLTTLTFRLNYLLDGQELIAYHFKITNVMCHAICTVLAWQSFYIILKSKQKVSWWNDEAYLSALLFSVHPIHTEAVSGIVGRADILAGIMFFATFLAYSKAVKHSTKQYLFYVFIAICYSGMSMILKENGITALGYCIIYEFVCKFKMKEDHSQSTNPLLKRPRMIRISTVLLFLAIFLYARWAVMGGTKPVFKPIDNPAAFSTDTFTKIATYNYVYFLNMLLLIWPQWLCYDWSMGCVPLVDNIKDYRLIFVLLMYMYGILLLKALVDYRNGMHFKSTIILTTSLIVLPFLPAANIFYPVGFVIAERVLYISSAGFCLLVVMGLGKIVRNYRKLGMLFYVLLLLIFSMKSWDRSFYWRDEYSLFTSGLSVCPLNAKVRYNIAKVADTKHHTQWALEEYKTAIRLYPEYYQAMNNLANLLKNLHQYKEAEFYLRKAISLKQDFPAAWMNLGIVLANTKRHKESNEAYKTALKYRSNYPDCYYNIGNLHLELNETQSAIDAWLEAIRLSPQHNLAWTNLLALLDNSGQFEKALRLMPEALKVLPSSPSINFAIGNIYGKMNRYEDAERHFLLAIKLFDKKVQAIHYANLGVLYHRWKKYSLAKEMYEKALDVDPLFKSASRNLKSLLKIMKDN